MRQALFVVGLVSAMSCGGSDRLLPATTLAPAGLTPTPLGTMTLSGTISETAPTASTRVSGVTVQVFCCGPNTGRSTTSDANGVFDLAGLEPGAFTIRTVSPRYVEGSLAVTMTGNQTVAIELDPVFQMVTTTRDGSLTVGDRCPGYWDDPTGEHCSVDYVFNVHHSGTLKAEISTTDRETSACSLDVIRLVDGLEASSPLPGGVDGVQVRAHSQYLVRVRKFALSGGPPPAGTTPFRLTVTHPS
jgi:hypothetical protein